MVSTVQYFPAGDRIQHVYEVIYAAEGEKVLSMLVNWTDKRNLYSVPSGFDFWSLAQNYKNTPLSRRCQTLADWQELWGLSKLDSLKGQPQFQHANWWSRIESNAEQVLPADFRLKPGSPGKGAGEGGKDLGADVEFVGPGEAFQQWQKAPGHQEWRKQTDALMSAAAKAQ